MGSMARPFAEHYDRCESLGEMLNMMKISLFLLGSLLTAPTLAETDNLRAFMLASSCAACHGPNGVSPGAMPSLQGKSAKFLELALREFRDGASSGTVMPRLAKGYTDEEIALIAAYYATRQP